MLASAMFWFGIMGLVLAGDSFGQGFRGGAFMFVAIGILELLLGMSFMVAGIRGAL